jgi:glucosamine-6-phosphate deaminase
LTLFRDCDVDLTFLTRAAVSDDELTKQGILKKVQSFCDSFEERVRKLGGIGFFLGGIGPDGHIAFNQEGCAHDSKTRLCGFNYPTAAAAASANAIDGAARASFTRCDCLSKKS